jgi:hypothetical protein
MAIDTDNVVYKFGHKVANQRTRRDHAAKWGQYHETIFDKVKCDEEFLRANFVSQG